VGGAASRISWSEKTLELRYHGPAVGPRDFFSTKAFADQSVSRIVNAQIEDFRPRYMSWRGRKRWATGSRLKKYAKNMFDKRHDRRCVHKLYEFELRASFHKKFRGRQRSREWAFLTIPFRPRAATEVVRLWAYMLCLLLRMFQRFERTKRFQKLKPWTFSRGEEIGRQSGTAFAVDSGGLVTGEYAYGHLQTERGRCTVGVAYFPLDANAAFTRGGRWPSCRCCSLKLLIPAKKTDEINPCRIWVPLHVCAAAAKRPGRTLTKERLRLPFDFCTTERNPWAPVQAERSQGRNRSLAVKCEGRSFTKSSMNKKRAKSTANGEKEADSKSPPGEAQLRSYVFSKPYQMVKDHRTELDNTQCASRDGGDIDHVFHSGRNCARRESGQRLQHYRLGECFRELLINCFAIIPRNQ